MKILIACSSGGHLAQALALRPWWGDHDRLWVTGPTPDAKMKLKGERAIACHWPTQRSIPNLLRNSRLARRVLRDYRPDIVFSTGAAVAVPFIWQAHSVGARSIFLETVDRIDNRPSAGAWSIPWWTNTSPSGTSSVTGCRARSSWVWSCE